MAEEWTDVKDLLPEHEMSVLVVDALSGNQMVARFIPQAGWLGIPGAVRVNVSHWRPLPPLVQPNPATGPVDVAKACDEKWKVAGRRYSDGDNKGCSADMIFTFNRIFAAGRACGEEVVRKKVLEFVRDSYTPGQTRDELFNRIVQYLTHLGIGVASAEEP